MGRDTLKPFRIVEVDRDYRRVTGVETKYFASLKEAKGWARKESWTGYDYHAYEDTIVQDKDYHGSW